jgi:hypothetical protein
MASERNDENADEEVDSKVARLIEIYEFGEEFGEQLEERWTAEGDQRESLRALANRFNERLLEAAMDDARMPAVEGEVGNLYHLLTGEDVSSGNRTEARKRLEQNGIDIEQLEQDFVTYQAIRTYLTEVRGATYEHKSDAELAEDAIDTVQQLISRTRSVASTTLNQLTKTDQLTLGEYRIFVDISVLCEDCSTQYGLVELLRGGSCNCDSK